ncbi:MAG: fumarylacetoacetate hydrolase family protein [Gammaproteobacteria bacterium]|nr:fumarylacetoacetate hydrolase family protein [Gammaproteobacteria bacterium]MDH4256610.1 fumarylacetoacetate hydrolase family protein [Gammaproteobacteria bacterium]MDH5310636.1 fumarylacetoacetate hydrolase family protein [Gammaproteobacteria bacterium]
MRLLTFVHENEQCWGAMTEKGIVRLGSASEGKYHSLRAAIEGGGLQAVAERTDAARYRLDPAEISYLPVVPDPGKILCIGLNYDTHRVETGREKSGYPTVFTRFADTQAGHMQNLVVPRVSRELDYEGELAVVIGKRGRYLAREAAMEHVAGYSCYNDASVRDFQRHTSQFTPGKNFPATAGFGPYLVTPEEVGDVHDLRIRTILNDEVMQDSNTGFMIFDIPTLISYLSTFTELMPGDIIATGTPGGVGFKRDPQVFLKPGDEVVVDIESIGKLVNPVTIEH